MISKYKLDVVVTNRRNIAKYAPKLVFSVFCSIFALRADPGSLRTGSALGRGTEPVQ